MNFIYCFKFGFSLCYLALAVHSLNMPTAKSHKLMLYGNRFSPYVLVSKGLNGLEREPGAEVQPLQLMEEVSDLLPKVSALKVCAEDILSKLDLVSNFQLEVSLV